MPLYTLREVVPEDWEFWRNLHHVAQRETIVRQFGRWDEFVQDGFARDGWKDSQGERAVIVVDGVDAGWWHLKHDGEGYFLNQIMVHPEFQGLGVGSGLLRELLARAKREGRAVKLQTLLANEARRFYEKLGFEVTDQTETHWVMQWVAE